MKETAKIQIGHLIKILEVLYQAHKEGKELFVSDLIRLAGLRSFATIYNIRNRLKQDGFIEEITNPDRTVTVRLTPKGVELAECLLKCKELIMD